jgi:hypothetical protein
MEHPDLYNPGLNTYRKNPSVWTHCLGKNNTWSCKALIHQCLPIMNPLLAGHTLNLFYRYRCFSQPCLDKTHQGLYIKTQPLLVNIPFPYWRPPETVDVGLKSDSWDLRMGVLNRIGWWNPPRMHVNVW